MDWWFFIEVFVGGLLSGVMYSLVALGFVLIFKASGVFNFAQGAMVLFAALTFVRLLEMGVPVLVTMAITIGVMILLAIFIERVMLRPLVNQDLIILFMATIGLNYFIEGFAQLIWGSHVGVLDLGIDQYAAFEVGTALINNNGFKAAIASLSIAVGLIMMVPIYFTERPGEKTMPWTKGKANTKSKRTQLKSWIQILRTSTTPGFLTTAVRRYFSSPAMTTSVTLK